MNERAPGARKHPISRRTNRRGTTLRGTALRAAAGVVVVAAGVAGFVGSLDGTGAATHTAAVAAPDGSYGSALAPGPAKPAMSLRAAASGAGMPAHGASEKVAAGGTTSQASDANGVGERIEETGALTVVVPGSRIQADISQLMTLAESLGGFVSSTQTQAASSGVPAQGNVTLQVPASSFGTAVAGSRALGKVTSLSTQASDVTGQYVDLQSQITAAEDTRQQYLTIMSKATTVGAILAVQAQLDNIQSQLQQLQGQLKQLGSETTYATLAVTLAQKVTTPPLPKPASGLLKAWRSAVGGFVSGLEAVVQVAGPLAFALLLAGVLYLAGRYLLRAWRRRQAAGTPPLP